MRFITTKKSLYLVASLVLALGVTACASYYKPPIPNITKTYAMPFENISAQGQVEVNVKQDKHWTISIFGPADIVQNPAIIKHDAHGFSIIVPENLARKYTRPLVVSVTAPALRNLTLQNGITFSAHDLRVINLKIGASGSSDVTLQGTIYASNTDLNQQGNGKIALAWLQSDEVKITASQNGLVLLAGVAKNLNVALFNSAYLDSKYLRTKNLVINAHNTSRADVLALRKMIARVDQKSNIYYYQRPNYMQIYPEGSGNVLLLK